MRKNIIITGLPKSGKSTLIKKVIASYEYRVGFVTNEMRVNGSRCGFEIETQDGEKTILAHTGFTTAYKVSRYYVDINNLEHILPKVTKFKSGDLLYLDEIGQMELFSRKFKDLANLYLESENISICSLSKVYRDEFTEMVMNRNDIILVEITKDNQDLQTVYVAKLLKKVQKAMRYVSERDRISIKDDGAEIRSDHGLRKLGKDHSGWSCDCDFYHNHKICSHVITIESI